MKRINKEKLEQFIFYFAVGISFLAIFFYNFFTPLMSDDLLFDTSKYESIIDIFRYEYINYMQWTGRSVVQLILRIFSLLPKSVFNIFNSVCFVVLTLLIYKNANGTKKYNTVLYIIINLLIWNFSVDFDQTVLWLGGAANYLWGTTIILSLITYYRYLLEEKKEVKSSVLRIIAMFIYGLLAGWCNENTSGGGILIILMVTIYYYIKNKRLGAYMFATIAGQLIGFLFMICAPGNSVRAYYMIEDHTGIMLYISRFLKITKSINEYMMVYIFIIILLGVYFWNKKKDLKEFVHISMFSIASIATCYALILSPSTMPRAYYGANIFLLVACALIIDKISLQDGLVYSLKNGLVIFGLIWMFFSYIENGANLARIYREINNREEYILEQVEKGNRDLVVPSISTDFYTEYSFVFDSDVWKEIEHFNNDCYCVKYDLNSIRSILPEEWSALMEDNTN